MYGSMAKSNQIPAAGQSNATLGELFTHSDTNTRASITKQD